MTKSGAYPRFLPDGKRLLYADRSAVWLIDAASKKTHEVIPAGTELDLLHFVVAPDGRSIYTLQALTESDIWEANLDGAAKP